MKRLLAVVFVVGCGSGSHGVLSPQPVNPDRIQRACAMEVSCLSPTPISPAGSCVSQFEQGLATGYGIFFGPSAQDLARYVDCASSNSSCDGALSCASRNHGPSYCGAHASPSCDGDTVITCLAGWGLQQVDCTQLGMHCGGGDGHASCTDGKTCDPMTAMTVCDGNKIVACSNNGLENAVDCGVVLSGATCKQVVSGNSSDIGCFPPPSASCAVDGQSCDGNTVVVCKDGVQQRLDCTQIASHCAVGAGTAGCVPDASDCTESSPDSCAGNSLQLCVNGAWKQTSCSSIGFSTCDTSSGAAACH